MPNKPDQQKHLDSTNLGSQLSTTWVERLKAAGGADIPQLVAVFESLDALKALREAILAWCTYLYCWNGNILYPMTSNRYNSLVERLGTQTFRTIASLDAAEKASQQLRQVLVGDDSSFAECLRGLLTDEESEPSAEPPKANAEPPKGVALEQNPLLVPPELSAAIGLQEAIVLQQIHYWLNKGAGKLIKGIRWIWNTLDDWLKQFPFLSKWELRKALRRLRDELGLVEFEQRQKHEWNRTGWYTINYQRLKALQLSMCEDSHIDVWPPTDRCVTAHTSYKETETSSEISEKTTTQAAVILNFEEEGGDPNLLALPVDQKEEEKDKPNLITSLANQKEEEPTGAASKTLGRDQFSGAALASVEKMDLVDDAGIPLNTQLERTLVNYTLEQVKAAVEHYRSVSRKKRLNNPAGWLTACLKGQWWVSGTITRQEVTHPDSRVYTAADFEVEKSPTVPQFFKDMIAGLASKRNLATKRGFGSL